MLLRVGDLLGWCDGQARVEVGAGDLAGVLVGQAGHLVGDRLGVVAGEEVAAEVVVEVADDGVDVVARRRWS